LEGDELPADLPAAACVASGRVSSRFVRLGAGVAEKHFPPNERSEIICANRPAAPCIIIRDVQELAGLLADRRDDARMAMPEAAHAQPERGQCSAAVGVPKVLLRPDEDDRQARVMPMTYCW